mmetsp:Transcript_29595/g.87721  ORF Transcript_29595/g.87721 Transcript_29595/m.87721 type:complete len:289 (-) Transcript_29595:522-1388(-)
MPPARASMPKERRGRYLMYAIAVTPQQHTVPTMRAMIMTAKYPTFPNIGNVDNTVVKMEKSRIHPTTRRAQQTRRRILVSVFSSCWAMSIISSRSCTPLRIIHMTPRLSCMAPQHFSSMTSASLTPYLVPPTSGSSAPDSSSSSSMICSTMNEQSNPSTTYSYTILQSPLVGSSPSGNDRRIPSSPLIKLSTPSTSSGISSIGNGSHSDMKARGCSAMTPSDRPNPPTRAEDEKAIAFGSSSSSSSSAPPPPPEASIRSSQTPRQLVSSERCSNRSGCGEGDQSSRTA